MEIEHWLATLISFLAGHTMGAFWTYLKYKKVREVHIAVHIPLPRTSDDIEYLAGAIGNIRKVIEGED